MVHIPKLVFVSHARFISRWKYRFSSDQRSQATLSGVSTEVGDHSGTLRDLAFFSLLLPSHLFHGVLGGAAFTRGVSCSSRLVVDLVVPISFGLWSEI